MTRVLAPAAIVAALSVLGGCWMDYRSALPAAKRVGVIDKHYMPGHYTSDCSDEKRGCSTTYHPPQWTVTYADLDGWHDVTVSSGVYDTLAIGQIVWVQYWEGGYTGLRYSTMFSPVRPNGESLQ